ncbi:AraC family transcriptional regulator [Stenotrophomonas maltophilia]|uniref:AraC family transcriptional regulator n=2 Tax=Stenotrophomonas maltophilia TaxID=40324 RepID=UPI002AB0FA67|nr:AraC family transcriptional regulator ligand-binding domain-containing protein [Stenotrophomonas maltophilia]
MQNSAMASNTAASLPESALLPATVPISIVNGFLSKSDPATVSRLATRCGLPNGLLGRNGARITREQFSLLYRTLANELDDEMPGVFSRPLRSGTLKYMCLSMIDAPRLEVALHRMSQFFHLVLDDFRISVGGLAGTGFVEVVPVGDNRDGDGSELGKLLLLKLVHGISSWLIQGQLPLSRIEFDFQRPPMVDDYLSLFPGRSHFSCSRSSISFSDEHMTSLIRQNRANLRAFLARAPEDWIFSSFAHRPTYNRCLQLIRDALPDSISLAAVAMRMHCSERTLCRKLSAEGGSFQCIKDEVRRDVAIQKLTQTDAPLSEVGAFVGFDNSTAFHRAFRVWTGSTPGSYRK